MRDLNEDSSSNSWPTFYGDKDITNGQQCYNGFVSRTAIDGYLVHDRDAMKQRMLEHETVFRSQLFELHRLYRIQKDMMEEVKRKELELNRLRFSTEPSSSSSLCGYQLTSGEAEKRLPLFKSYGRASASGFEIGNSPMSCTKEYNRGPSQLPFLNGSSLKGSESLDSRPSKVRKKLFDLQLPADRYVDTEERENFPENNIGLADLNKPIQIEEETVVPSSINFLGHGSVLNGDTKGLKLPEKSGESFVAVNGEKNIHIPDEFLLKPGLENKINEGRIPHIYEAGSSKRNLFIQDKSSASNYTMSGMHNQIHHNPGMLHHNLLASDQSRERSSNGHLEYPVASRPPCSYPFFTSSCFSNSWAQSSSSHLVPAGSFTRKRAIFDSSSNSVTTVDRNLQPSAQSQVPFGGNWMVNSSCSLNPSLAGELTRNGFYRGSTSGTRETQVFPALSGLNYRNTDRGNSLCHEDKKQTIDIDLNEVVDLTIEDERDKPEDRLSSLPWLKNKPSHAKEAANTRQDEFPGDKRMHHSSSNQSWWKNETVKDLDRQGNPRPAVLTSDCEILETKTVKKILGVSILETNAHENDRSYVSPTLASVCFHVEGNDVNNEQKKRIIDINLECETVDDDVADEVEPDLEKENQTNIGVVKNQIDLNSCVSDSEDPPVLSFESKTTTVKRILEIDLEALLLQESEDDLAGFKENTKDNFLLQSLENKNMMTHEESLRDAAEIIFSISSLSFCPQTHVEDNVNPPSEPLLWFVDIVSSYSSELDNTHNNDDSSEKESFEEIDDFEAMTLQLQEMKEDDYLPGPFIPEILEIEERETNNSLLSRSRRGHSRRGRQRKDFQRDILPGLSTLSRHEVTEDLQTFGGIMRAMGHHWNSGLTRRNGGARGRRRAAIVEAVLNVVVQNQVCAAPLVQKLNSNFERGLEDRSLTGWGKTTRRPRRQRCHAGNNAVTAVLT